MNERALNDILIRVDKQDVAVRRDGQRLSLLYGRGFCALVFLLGFALYLLSVLPILYRNQGLFFYYGDYNVQQVPFYILTHRAVRNGTLLWTWNIDLGGTMVGDMSFYLLGSPFFWLTIPFREETLPYLMPFIMALKSGVATLTAFLYLKRYVSVSNRLHAVTGALLYAFSGYAACNIVFQHFHDVIAFFPLLMVAFEELMAQPSAGEGRKRSGLRLVLFALSVTLLSVTSYYFFYGEVIFLILYFIVRYVPINTARQNFKMIGKALLGGVPGLCLGAFFLVQALAGVAGNGRLDNLLTGYATLVYPEAKMPFDFLKALVMIPDIIGKGTLFFTDTVKNASLAVYLPMFGIAGIASYLFLKKKHPEDVYGYDYKKVLTVVFVVIALVPFFNAAFSLFNSQYYARWFYMPILIFALMTTQALCDIGDKAWRKGALITTGCYLFMVGVACLPSTDAEGNLRYFNMTENPDFFKLQVIGTGVMCVLLLFIVYILPYLFHVKGITLIFTIASVLITNIIVLHNGASLISEQGMQFWKNQMLETKPVLDDAVFSRAETDSTSTNYEMVWGVPSIHCFLSTVPAGIFDFYEYTAGIYRTVESDPPLERKGLRALLSARYYFENALVNTDGEFLRGEGIVDYYYTGSQNGFDIYENANFLPMGFAFDSYILEEAFLEADKREGDEFLVEALILSSDDAAQYASALTQKTAADITDFYFDDKFDEAIRDRRRMACESFTALPDGFTARTASFDKDTLVFFSMPYMRGLNASVDGKETALVKADFGLTAVPVPKGAHEIRVSYHPPYVKAAVIVSVIALLSLVLCLFFDRYSSKSKEPAKYLTNTP